VGVDAALIVGSPKSRRLGDAVDAAATAASRRHHRTAGIRSVVPMKKGLSPTPCIERV